MMEIKLKLKDLCSIMHNDEEIKQWNAKIVKVGKIGIHEIVIARNLSS